MFKKIRYSIYAVSLLVAIFIYPYSVAFATGECLELKVIYKHLLSVRKIPMTTWKIDNKGRVIISFMDFRTGAWADVGVLPDAKGGCIIDEGPDSGHIGMRWEL